MSIKLLDCTLRDGGYINDWNFGEHTIRDILTKLIESGTDYVEVGCNSVLNPGTVIGRNSNIYPTSCVRGYIPANSIYKNEKEIVEKATSF